MSNLTIWTEKYRPQKLDEVIGQKHVVDRLKLWVNEKSIPNMMFAGSAGVGKTTTALALAKEIFGQHWKENFSETNASDERGIDVVRGKVKDFAKTMPFGSEFKIVFLDEADALTPEAQHALRRTIEKYSNVCRFVLSCVSPDTKIILPEEQEITISRFMELFQSGECNSVLNFSSGSSKKEDAVLASVKLQPASIGKKVLEFKTMSGRELKATEDHRLLTKHGWKQASELNIGDKVIVFPSLEGTPYEKDERVFIKEEDFEEFLNDLELRSGYKELADLGSFRRLSTRNKEKVIRRMYELDNIIRSGKTLTKVENTVYRIIKNNSKPISRIDIQNMIGLSRIRIVQILRSIENKGYIFRIVNKKTHLFKLTGTVPYQLRNRMDIRKSISVEYGINVSYTSVKNHLSGKPKEGLTDRNLGELGKRSLLNIRYSDRRAPVLARLVAFIFGDGHITKAGSRAIFTGSERTLKEVKVDLEVLGFQSSQIFSKRIKSVLNGREIDGITKWFHIDSRPLINLLQYLNAPKGDKILVNYSVPYWVMDGPRLIKREFLRGLFGCEGYSPKIKDKNFEAVTLRMHKSRQLKENMLLFFGQIKNLLSEFGVESYITIKDQGFIRKDSNVTDIYQLILKSSNKNLYNFFSKVGYAYDPEKSIKARMSAEYLKHKLHVLEEQRKLGKQIVESAQQYTSIRQIAKDFGCSLDFAVNQIKGKEAHIPRNFPSFSDWKKDFYFENELVYNEIKEIRESESNDVMDLTCLNDHNFVSNGIISHNCNYSSKIIEPIQSRCVVFRFKALTKEQIEEYITRIVKAENLQIDKDAEAAICEISEGDLRKVANLLQACASHKHITKDLVYEISAQVKPEDVKKMLNMVLSGNFEEARKQLYNLTTTQGLAGEEIIKTVHKELFNLPLEEKAKLELLEKIGDYEFRLNGGATPEIQLLALLAQFLKYKK